MTKKILCVDDDPNILQGYKRALRKDFDISIAEGGEPGLALIAQEGPFAVIVSDMRMPGMDGVQFLSRVKETAPTYQYEDEDQSTGMALKLGMKVRHPQFGVGTVLSVEALDDDTKLVVRFANVGTKTLRAKFARLEPA